MSGIATIERTGTGPATLRPLLLDASAAAALVRDRPKQPLPAPERRAVPRADHVGRAPGVATCRARGLDARRLSAALPVDLAGKNLTCRRGRRRIADAMNMTNLKSAFKPSARLGLRCQRRAAAFGSTEAGVREAPAAASWRIAFCVSSVSGGSDHEDGRRGSR